MSTYIYLADKVHCAVVIEVRSDGGDGHLLELSGEVLIGEPELSVGHRRQLQLLLVLLRHPRPLLVAGGEGGGLGSGADGWEGFNIEKRSCS